MRRLGLIVTCIALNVAVTPSTAAADWLITPYVGALLLDIADTGKRPVIGGSISWRGPVAGVELDLGDGPAFLDSRPGQPIDRSNLLTMMGNVVVQIPAASRRIQPYAVGGIGLVHTTVRMPDNALEIGDEHFGLSVGGGVVAFLNERVGLRGDLRYFRAVRNDDATVEADALGISEIECLRATFGVTFRF